MSKKSRKHKICTNICDVSACVCRLHTLFGTCKERGAQHKSSNTLHAASLTITRPTNSPNERRCFQRWRRCCCQRPMRSAVDSLRTLIRNAFGTSLCCSLPPACLLVCAFVLLLTYSLLKSRSLSLSCFVSFSAAVAASAAAASAAWAWHCWLFGDACLFLSSFAPRDDGPAKFCPCFKNCSVLNFVLFGFIIRTHTYTCTCTCTNFPQSSQHQIPRRRHTSPTYRHLEIFLNQKTFIHFRFIGVQIACSLCYDDGCRFASLNQNCI